MTCRSAERGTRRSSSRILAFAVMLPALTFAGSASAETWRGLTVTPEDRCSPYERKRDYPYSQSVEQDNREGDRGVVHRMPTPLASRYPAAYGHRRSSSGAAYPFVTDEVPTALHRPTAPQPGADLWDGYHRR